METKEYYIFYTHGFLTKFSGKTSGIQRRTPSLTAKVRDATTRSLTVIQPDSYKFYININFFIAATEPDFYERRKLPTYQTHSGFNSLSG